MQLRENVHQAVHTIFQDATPIQRLRRMIDIDKSTLHPDVYAEINKVLSRIEQIEMNAYDPRLFDSDLFLKRMKK